jgi:hypothetical protein
LKFESYCIVQVVSRTFAASLLLLSVTYTDHIFKYYNLCVCFIIIDQNHMACNQDVWTSSCQLLVQLLHKIVSNYFWHDGRVFSNSKDVIYIPILREVVIPIWTSRHSMWKN